MTIQFRPILLVIALLSGVLPLTGYTQSDDRSAAITSKLEQFFQATQEKDWDQVLDLTYPKLYELVPREQMLEVFQSMESQGMGIEMNNMKIHKIYGAEDYENETFTAVDYSMQLKLILHGDDFDDDTLDFMKTSFETTYGAEKISLDRDNKTFVINADKTLFAIANIGELDWHFIEKNAEQTMILEKLIPEEVMRKFE